MRTTIAIDDAILESVRRLAKRRNQSVGETVTELLRRALSPSLPATTIGDLPVMPVQADAGQADVAIVNALRDEIE